MESPCSWRWHCLQTHCARKARSRPLRCGWMPRDPRELKNGSLKGKIIELHDGFSWIFHLQPSNCEVLQLFSLGLWWTAVPPLATQKKKHRTGHGATPSLSMSRWSLGLWKIISSALVPVDREILQKTHRTKRCWNRRIWSTYSSNGHAEGAHLGLKWEWLHFAGPQRAASEKKCVWRWKAVRIT